MKLIHVVAAIIQKNEKVLITRRAAHKSLAGYWEFPGGKVDDNEEPKVALAREIQEELGIIVEVREFVESSIHRYDFGTIQLDGYTCKLVENKTEISSTDHDLLRWCSIEELENYDFAPADIPIVKKLAVENISNEC